MQGPTLMTLKALLFISLITANPELSGVQSGCSPLAFSSTMSAVAAGAVSRRLGPEPDLAGLQELEGLLSFDGNSTGLF